MSQRAQQPKVEIGAIAIDTVMSLRRMVIQPTEPKGTVLLLHGFPETLYAWKDIALPLADDYEVHAFDWPGLGFHRARRSIVSPMRPETMHAS